MPRAPILASTALVLLALVAWGCASSDDGPTSDQAAAAVTAGGLQIASPNFTQIRPRVRIPKTHTCYGENISPPLNWSGIPEGTMSLALTVDDIVNDSSLWVHWVMYNIPPDLTGLPEDVPTTTDVLLDGTIQGVNDFQRSGYGGPCIEPVTVRKERAPNLAPHKFYFTLYALDSEIGLAAGATKQELESAMKGHILAQAHTVGVFSRPLPENWMTYE